MKVTQQTYNRIENILKREIPTITDQHIRWLAEHGFDANNVKETLETAYNCDDMLKISMINSMIEREKAEDQQTLTTGKTTIPVSTLPGVNNPPPRQQIAQVLQPTPPQTASGNARDRKWWKYGGGALALIAVVVVAVLANTISCDGNVKNAATSVSTTCHAVTKDGETQMVCDTNTATSNPDLAKRVEALETNVSNLDAKVDLQGQVLNKKLDGDVAELKAQLENKVDKTDFSDNMHTISDAISDKADKKALGRTNKRVSRLEQKLNAHIAADAQAPDTTTAQPAGTTTLVIQKVLVDQ